MSLINQNNYIILLIEDNPADSRLIKEMLRDETDFSFDLIWKENLKEGLNYLKENNVDITLLDLGLPDSSGIDTFYKTFEIKPTSPIILLTGLNDKNLALRAIEKGAQDFILKGELDGNLLVRSILHAIERQRMLLRLKESEKKLLLNQFMLDNAAVPALLIDSNNNIRYVNEHASINLGYTREELLSLSLSNFILPKDPEIFQRSILNAKNKTSFSIEMPFLRKDQTSFPVQINMKYFEYDNEIFSCLFFSDLTDRMKLEKLLEEQNINLEKKVKEQTKLLSNSLNELKSINKELEIVNTHKTRFISALSHELRTPLNSIIGFSDLLSDQAYGSLNEKQQKCVQKIISSGIHISEIIEDLLDISRIDSGKVKLQLEEHSPTQLIEEVLDAFENTLNNKELTVTTNLSNDVPTMLLDKKRFKQIIFNLMSNATKFTPNKGKIEVISKIIYKNMLEIIVKDSGIGISKDKINNIFEEFYQIESPVHQATGGLGIGLPLTKKLVGLHYGKIDVESELNHGSTFIITMPITFPSAKAVVPASKVYTFDDLPEDKIILIAEDNPTNLDLLVNILSTVNYKLITASNGDQAVKLALAEKPDLILMDISMPIMDGLQATKIIRNSPEVKDIPIIAVTAIVDEQSKKEQIKAGFDATIEKPVNIDKLIEILYLYLT